MSLRLARIVHLHRHDALALSSRAWTAASISGGSHDHRTSLFDAREPCLIHGLQRDWRCVRERRWTADALRERYGSRLFECGTCVETGEPNVVRMSEYLRSFATLRASPALPIDNTATGSPRHRPYLFDATFEDDCAELLDDYSVPRMFSPEVCGDALAAVPLEQRPNFRWCVHQCSAFKCVSRRCFCAENSTKT
jgi:hypothetical protein